MTEFVSLTASLEGWFDKPLRDLPKGLRERVEEAFWPNLWDVVSAEQRQYRALQWDYDHDPATLDERQRVWDLVVKKHETESKIRELELMAVTTPLEIESKTRQIVNLQQQLEHLKATEAIDSTVARYRDGRKQAAESKTSAETNKPSIETTVADVHFLVAREMLKERLGATPQEIAIWVWMGKKSGEIDGYRDALLYDDEPPKFYFPPFDSFDNRFDYVSEMMHCYFRRSDLDAFTPSDRYLTYAQLVERWRTRLTEQEIVALINAEGATGELTGFHPLTGSVQGAGYGMNEKEMPPLDQGMFCLAHVEAVEGRVFPNAAPGEAELPGAAGTTIKAEKQCEAWLRNLMATGSSSMPKYQYQLEAIRQFKISRRSFGRAWGNAVAATGNITWSLPGRKSKRRIDTPK
jgi:hypothetical protein